MGLDSIIKSVRGMQYVSTAVKHIDREINFLAVIAQHRHET